MRQKKYIEKAIVWNGIVKAWIIARDLSYIEEYGESERFYKGSYVSACAPNVAYRTVFEYEDWMYEYIGTQKKLFNDERLKEQTTR